MMFRFALLVLWRKHSVRIGRVYFYPSSTSQSVGCGFKWLTWIYYIRWNLLLPDSFARGYTLYSTGAYIFTYSRLVFDERAPSLVYRAYCSQMFFVVAIVVLGV